MTAPQTALPNELYGTISGVIDQPALQRILGGFGFASQNGVQTAHVLFQSTGGGIGEGIALYNYFRALQIDLTIYNVGSVSSIAVIAYLGARHRKVSRHGTFMIHRTQTTTQAANTQTIKAFAESAVLFDKNTESILREHIKNLPAEKWAHFNHNDLWFSAEDAVKFGLADEIADFAPPLGAKIFAL
jgi:ATP-dependent Clp protease protease subunit